MAEVAHARPKNGRARELSRDEAWKVFDAAARRYLHISGDDFVRNWERHAYDPDPDDHPGVMQVAVLLPLIR